MRLDVRVFALAAAAGAVLLGGPSASAQAAGTTLYKWVDEQGVTHYSDRPRPGATEVDVPAAQGYRAPAPRFVPRRDSGDDPQQDPGAARYTRVEIVRPAADEVFINTGGAPVDVAAVVEPALGPGHQVWFFLNGQRLADLPTATASAAITVPRGSHSVAVRIVDANGRTLASSAPVTFHVRQTSVATPPQGPLLQRPRT